MILPAAHDSVSEHRRAGCAALDGGRVTVRVWTPRKFLSSRASCEPHDAAMVNGVHASQHVGQGGGTLLDLRRSLFFPSRRFSIASSFSFSSASSAACASAYFFQPQS
jgi:hypothetical protein